MSLTEIRTLWRERRATTPIDATPRFDGDWLVHGAGTRLAKAGAPGDEWALRLGLTAACGRIVVDGAVRHVTRALELHKAGDSGLSAMHLALGQVSTFLEPEEASWRLFAVDAMIARGMEPKGFMTALAGLSGVEKHDPNQPRVPSGNGESSGRWTSDDNGSAATGSNGAPDGKPQTNSAPIAAPSLISASETGTVQPPISATGNVVIAQDEGQKCQDFIASNCRAMILRVFPGQYLACTLDEVQKAAKEGDAAAKTACKLLSRKIYRK